MCLPTLRVPWILIGLCVDSGLVFLTEPHSPFRDTDGTTKAWCGHDNRIMPTSGVIRGLYRVSFSVLFTVAFFMAILFNFVAGSSLSLPRNVTTDSSPDVRSQTLPVLIRVWNLRFYIKFPRRISYVRLACPDLGIWDMQIWPISPSRPVP